MSDTSPHLEPLKAHERDCSKGDYSLPFEPTRTPYLHPPPWSVVAVMDDVLLIDVGGDRLQELETIVIIRS